MYRVLGHFGAGVITYFQFLKWLFQLNLLIAFLLFLFIILPEAVLDAQPYPNTTVGLVAEACSAAYEVNKTDVWYEHILDFFQGTVSIPE